MPQKAKEKMNSGRSRGKVEIMKKTVKVIFNRSGGTAGSGGITNRITIPTTWVKEMGITEEQREVNISFDGEKIMIEKA